MIWKLTGWPLRLYQLIGLFLGLSNLFMQGPLYLIITIGYMIFGLTVFHTGKKIFWSYNLEGWQSWGHKTVPWMVIGIIIAEIIKRFT